MKYANLTATKHLSSIFEIHEILGRTYFLQYHFLININVNSDYHLSRKKSNLGTATDFLPPKNNEKHILNNLNVIFEVKLWFYSTTEMKTFLNVLKILYLFQTVVLKKNSNFKD